MFVESAVSPLRTEVAARRLGTSACAALLSAFVLAGCAATAVEAPKPRPLERPTGCGQVTYPSAALQQGLEALVQVRLQIDATGQVTDAQVNHDQVLQSLQVATAGTPIPSDAARQAAATAFADTALQSARACRFAPAPGYAPAQATLPYQFTVPQTPPAAAPGQPNS